MLGSVNVGVLQFKQRKEYKCIITMRWVIILLFWYAVFSVTEKHSPFWGENFAYSWTLCSEVEKTLVVCKMIEVQCVVLRADAVFLESSKLLLEFTCL